MTKNQTPCTEPGCSGSIDSDGYCDTCGARPSSASPQRPAASASPKHILVQGSVPALGPACAQPGCGGTVAADAYCDTCGMVQGSPTSTPVEAPRVQPRPTSSIDMDSPCNQPGCDGKIAADGYCDNCGMAAGSAPVKVAPSPSKPSSQRSKNTAGWNIAVPVAPDRSAEITNSGTLTPRTRASLASRIASARTGIGAGLVKVAPTPVGDPVAAVMSPEQVQSVLGVVPEDKRFCNACGLEVGRASGTPGDKPRTKGFCSQCRAPYDFVTNRPSLERDELVAGQYAIVGPLAHGGMGWIYLGQDKGVSNRWIVLKGILDNADPDAVAAAMSERRFLAETAHANIVDIYNFVTHRGSGYIVMEMVGGESLNAKLKQRRDANGGIPDPLPPTDAIAYILGVLPALGFLHHRGLVYNDLKPANIMAVDDDVKLIDLGAVMRIDDIDAAIFGTAGIQAPEVAVDGPSVASDLYTVGRTLAVLLIRFTYHVGPYIYELPPPEEAPLFSQHESLYRFLLRATAKHPDDRFQSADEMATQLRGVLREIASLEQGVPLPTTSELFFPDRLPELLSVAGDHLDPSQADWRLLPGARPDPDSEEASFLRSLSAEPPTELLASINLSMAKGGLQPSIEVDLRKVWESLLSNERIPVRQAVASLKRLAVEDPWDWRVVWYTAIVALRNGRARQAAELFSQVWTELPGETAPKFAVALASELAGNTHRAQSLYQLITRVDSSFVSAAFGLARCYQSLDQSDSVIEALNRIPASSSAHYEAQVATVKTLINSGPDGGPTLINLTEAASMVERLQLNAAERASLSASIFEQALDGLETGQIPPSYQQLLGQFFQEQTIREGLASAYRQQARLSEDRSERERLIDKANLVRPWSLL